MVTYGHVIGLQFDNCNLFHIGVRQFLHRMVVCLDDEILPFVPIAVESLMKNADAKELHDFIPLINQLVCKFKVRSVTKWLTVGPTVTAVVV